MMGTMHGSYREHNPNRIWEVYSLECTICNRLYIGSCDCAAFERIAEHYHYTFDVRHERKQQLWQLRHYGKVRPRHSILEELKRHHQTVIVSILAQVTGPQRTKQMLRATEQHFIDQYDAAKTFNKIRAFAGNPTSIVLDGIEMGVIHLADYPDKYPIRQFLDQNHATY